MITKRSLLALAVTGTMALTGAGAAYACDRTGGEAGEYPGSYPGSTDAGEYPGASTDATASTTATTAAYRPANGKKPRPHRPRHHR